MDTVTEESLEKMGYTPAQIPLALDLQDRLLVYQDGSDMTRLFSQVILHPRAYGGNPAMLDLVNSLVIW